MSRVGAGEIAAAIESHSKQINHWGGPARWCESRDVDWPSAIEAVEGLNIALGPTCSPGLIFYCVAIGMEIERARRDRDELPA